MVKYFVSLLIITAALSIAVAGDAQVTISGSTKVASGSSSCYSASTTCTTKTFCWSGSGLSSITPESSCGGGGGEESVRAGSMVPNTGGGGGSCNSPAMALVVFPSVSTTTTAYIYITNYCSIQNNLAVTIVPPPAAPTVSPSTQTVICPAAATILTMGTPQGGDGTYSYQWYSSPDNSTWTAVSGATANSYTPPAPTPGVTMYYRLQIGSFGMSATSGSVSVIGAAPALVPGTVSPASQTIQSGTAPSQLQAPVSSGGGCGTVTYTYLWYASTDGTNFSSTGVTSQNYTLGAVSQNTWYKRYTSSSAGTSGYSNTVSVTVYPPLSGGTITAPSAPVGYDTIMSLSNSVLPSGGNCGGDYGYYWYASVDGGNTFTQVALSGGALTLPPQTITAQVLFYRTVYCNGQTANSNTVTVNVAPPLTPGELSPSSLSIPVGASPGELSYTSPSGGNCGGNYVYSWQSSTDNINWTTISGATGRTYDPGGLSTSTYFRVTAACGGSSVSSTVYITVGTTGSDQNYVRTRTILRPSITDLTSAGALSDPYDVQQVTQYLDGLGRPLQTVAMAASPLGKDLVSTQLYDAFGRTADSYLPYADVASDGNYKPGALAAGIGFNSAMYPGENYTFGHVDYEPSPLGRPLMVYSAGNSWIGSERGIGSGYYMNLASDSVHMWNASYTSGGLPTDGGLYAAQALDKTITTDEQGHQVVEYKDKDGQVVLKKVQLADAPGSAHVGWLCTYYVYDDFHRLRFVVPPRAVELINQGSAWSIPQTIADELCFRYEYDLRGRMIVKKVPGAGAIYMVYDARDRLTLTQDANLRKSNQWLFTKYDVLNRPVVNGTYTDATNIGQSAMQVYMNAQNPGLYETYNNANYPEYTLNQSFPVVTQPACRTFIYYDDYTWVGWYGFGNKDNSFDSHFSTAGSSYPYPQPLTQSALTAGLTTGVWNVTGPGVLTSTYYDDHGRVIQTKFYNYTGGIDITTTQYDFSGRPLQTYLRHQKKQNTVQTHYVNTRMNYDAAGRVISIYKNIDSAAVDQLIASMQYDELGQLHAKYLGKDPVTGAALDSLVYDHNIRGWLTGINKNYVGGTKQHYFGMELAYDNPASISGATYATPAYNGNIAGVVWKSAGDGVDRKYDFTYDAVNRLTAGAYLDNHSGGGWDHTAMDFTVDGLTYDANGNILTMNQHGFRVGNPTGLIDQLQYRYEYHDSSNKLTRVMDGFNDTASVLGDFHWTGAKGDSDYVYDGNGNLTADNNKGIDATLYTLFNLPQQVHIKGKGNINYVIDDFGNKSMKQTVDSAAGIVTTTLYLSGFQYQRRSPLNNMNAGVDTLQFVGHEEGRARWAYHKHLAGDSVYAWEYDFYEKDHLGNTRVLLSQEKDTAQYVATMERAYRATEDALFYNIDSTSYPTSSVPGGFPAEPNGTSPNDSVARVDGAGVRMGPALLLKVMSGDSIGLGVYSYYTGTGTAGTPNSSFNNVLNSLASGLVGITGGSHGSVSTLAGSPGAPVYSSLNSFLQDSDANTTTKPKAYLNWMLLDNQFNYVGGNGQSGALPVGASGVLNTLGTGIRLNHSGYLYIWVSNETPDWPVFFDNLSVVHFSGPLLEEDHYYPGGLTMAGISDKALKFNYAENKYRFNFGSELQNKEFSDGSGLELYDAHHRMYDPQIGRFGQLDPLGDATPYYSPYSFASNNPISHIDPFGLEDTVVTTRTTNLPPVEVIGHAHAHWFYYPESTQYDRDKWTFHQHLYQDRLAYGQPLNQKGDPAGYTASKPMYDRWAQADKEGRAMQAWAVGIMASPALLAVSPAEVGLALQMKAGVNLTAFAVDAGVQSVASTIEHKNIFANYNVISGGAALLIGVPEEAPLANVVGVNLAASTLGTSVNVSWNSITTKDPMLSFHPLSILINTAFGAGASGVSQAVGGGAIGDITGAPVILSGAAVDEATKPKENQ